MIMAEMAGFGMFLMIKNEIEKIIKKTTSSKK